MASRSLGFFEKIANLTGAIYRSQSSQWPRRFIPSSFYYIALWLFRSALLKGVFSKELAPPKMAEWPAIKVSAVFRIIRLNSFI